MKLTNRCPVKVPLLFLACIQAACGDTTWPIEPVDSDHHVGTTMGEFIMGDGGGYQHEGIDILGKAYDQSTATSPAPYVVVTVGGKVEAVQMNPDDRDNYLMIRSNDGSRRYVYAHLEASTIPIPLKLKINGTNLNQPNAWPELEEGAKIAQLTNMFPCDFDHVHYEVQQINEDQSLTVLNPLLDIDPNEDLVDPEIVKIHLAQHDGTKWNEIPQNPDSDSCTTVSGKIDIVVEVMDRDGGASNQLGVNKVGLHDVRWRACRNLFCRWKKTHVFDEMPANWTIGGNQVTARHFSTDNPWPSTFGFCGDMQGNKTFIVLTSFTETGSWDTDNYPNDEYEVSVKAKDLANNSVTDSIKVCVDN
jgi:hypothetical protein